MIQSQMCFGLPNTKSKRKACIYILEMRRDREREVGGERIRSRREIRAGFRDDGLRRKILKDKRESHTRDSRKPLSSK